MPLPTGLWMTLSCGRYSLLTPKKIGTLYLPKKVRLSSLSWQLPSTKEGLPVGSAAQCVLAPGRDTFLRTTCIVDSKLLLQHLDKLIVVKHQENTQWIKWCRFNLVSLTLRAHRQHHSSCLAKLKALTQLGKDLHLRIRGWSAIRHVTDHICRRHSDFPLCRARAAGEYSHSLRKGNFSPPQRCSTTIMLMLVCMGLTWKSGSWDPWKQGNPRSWYVSGPTNLLSERNAEKCCVMPFSCKKKKTLSIFPLGDPLDQGLDSVCL